MPPTANIWIPTGSDSWPTTYNNNTGGATQEIWLRTPRGSMEMTNLRLEGAEGVEDNYTSKGAYFVFDSEVEGSYEIKIPVPSGSSGTMRVLQGTLILGENRVYWDGKGGDGNYFDYGESLSDVDITVKAAEVHFPFIDVENNTRGISIQALDQYHNPHSPVGNSDLVWWDVSELPDSGVNPPTNKNNSTTGHHSLINDNNQLKWGEIDGGNNFGDNRAIVQWINQTQLTNSTSLPINKIHTDLLANKPTISSSSSSVATGESIDFSALIGNDGPYDATGYRAATFMFYVPDGISIDPNDVSFASSNGAALVSDSKSIETVTDSQGKTFNVFVVKVDMPNESTGTFNIPSLVSDGSKIASTINVWSTIMRASDIEDPNAFNSDSSITYPADPFQEANGIHETVSELDLNDPSSIGLSSTNNINYNNDSSINLCTTGCNENAYFNSSDPNTIEYDNMVSGYHATLLKEADNRFLVWGEKSAANGSKDLYSPTPIVKANGFDYEGQILKATLGGKGGSDTQFVILTTEGLYAWGSTNSIISEDIYNSKAFGKVTGIVDANTYGLPGVVEPEDVKMMFGSYQTLAITTCTGEAYVLSFNGDKNGDGSVQFDGDNNRKWHRVSTAAGPLDNIVAVRGNSKALIAQTLDGKLYTWGTDVYLGDNTAKKSINIAEEMTLPSMDVDERVKMIGMTLTASGLFSTYYLLTTKGKVWSLGYNNSTRRMLGDPTNTSSDSKTWIQPKKPNVNNDGYLGGMDDIVWISPNEHDATRYGAINVIDQNGKLIAWGENNARMLGVYGPDSLDPYYMPGSSNEPNGLHIDDQIFAVETGGHTSMIIKHCTLKFGYVGHKTSGSMGDGKLGTGQEDTYTFDTSPINLCGASFFPSVEDEIEICVDDKIDLNTLVTTALPDAYDGYAWYTTPTGEPGSEVVDPSSVGVGTYYVNYDGVAACDGLLPKVVVETAENDLAQPDINQTPMNITVDGDVVTNDIHDDIFVKSAKYWDHNNEEQTLALSTPTTIFDENKVEAGSITLEANGIYTFVPATDYIGEVVIEYTAIIDDCALSTTTLTIIVLPVVNPAENYDPVAQDDTAVTLEGVPVNGNVLSNDSDPDGDNSTLVVTEFTYLDESGDPHTVPAGTTVEVHDENGNYLGELTLDADGKFTFDPAPGFTGTVPPISYEIVDEDGGTDTANLHIVVLPEPEDYDNSTFANDDANSAPKGETMEGNVLDNDFDAEGHDQEVTAATATFGEVDYPLTIGSPTVIPGVGTITLNDDGSYTFVPEPDFVGTLPVKYTVCDDGTPQACDEATLYLTNLDIKGKSLLITNPMIYQKIKKLGN